MTIAYVESRAAFARINREKRLSAGDYRRTVRELEADWERYLLLEVTAGIIRTAAELAETRGLRAYDAIHLAAAKLLRERLQGPLLFACWDSDLAFAAKREGLALVQRK